MKHILIFCCVILACFGVKGLSAEITYPASIKQGGVDVVTIIGGGPISTAVGSFNGRTVYFNPASSDTEYLGLVSAHLQTDPKDASLRVEISYVDGTSEIISRSIAIVDGDYETQYLTLDEKWTSYDEETLARIQRENNIIGALFKTETPDKLWTEPFMMPLLGRITGEFGLRRYINDEPRSPHSGIDISAVTGTPILAANDGRTVLVMDMFFSGLSLFIDHGQGLYTMYFHLSDVLVEEGDDVRRGDTVALVGATGRVTGAHLHFGVRHTNNKVNPWDLVNALSP
ncbi:MAG: M23 family metallopeptidase [Deltaproteobacteria bacterium]|nr:M23 family metallopeptidase [Candidatus Zymogenaceae bacterium]